MIKSIIGARFKIWQRRLGQTRRAQDQATRSWLGRLWYRETPPCTLETISFDDLIQNRGDSKSTEIREIFQAWRREGSPQQGGEEGPIGSLIETFLEEAGNHFKNMQEEDALSELATEHMRRQQQILATDTSLDEGGRFQRIGEAYVKERCLEPLFAYWLRGSGEEVQLD